uniref:H/ACA ribonucleoprotein complex non-core subunit NAF1 n=1 Tax=Elaeophora elaphi TaxID=1147741 RepID=A0A0R3S0H5_9BILA
MEITKLSRESSFQNDLLQTVVADVVTNVVDLVCKGCTSFDYSFNRFNIVDPTSFRVARSTRNIDELSESAFTVHSSSDSSDDEFDRILESARRQTSLQQEEEDDDLEVPTLAKKNAKLIEHEYDMLPAIEELRIHVEEDIVLEQFGRIVNIVDRLVVIEANSNIALDFDTVIFDAERNAVGRVHLFFFFLHQIFDIFGPVAKPMYAILFNNIKEANEWRVGSAMYYAPAASQFTHTIFTEKLRQEKVTDGCWDGEGECPDDMLAFSDDETEQRYKAKHRSVKVNNKNQHMFDSPKSKKARYASKCGRLKYRNNRGHSITRQFRNGLEQYGGSVLGSTLERNPTQQSSFWSAAVNKDGLQQFQPGFHSTSFGMPERPSHSFFGRNSSRQELSFHSLEKSGKVFCDGVFPRTNEISSESMNNLPFQHSALNSSLNNHYLYMFSNPRRP